MRVSRASCAHGGWVVLRASQGSVERLDREEKTVSDTAAAGRLVLDERSGDNAVLLVTYRGDW